jgi:hypothetical protein
MTLLKDTDMSTFMVGVHNGELSDQSPFHSVLPHGLRNLHSLTPLISKQANRVYAWFETNPVAVFNPSP